MNTHTAKTTDNKSQAVANNLTQNISGKSDSELKNSGLDAIQRKQQLAVNNGQSAQQRTYHEMANNSPRVNQLKEYQAAANHDQSPALQRKNSSQGRSLDVTPQPVQRKENNTGLPDDLKSGAESLSGHSLDDVKVHYNSAKPAELQAHAYAQGSDIHLAPGQEKHLPHEAWHVVQQKQGRVKATRQMKGEGLNDDAGLEKEADDMGAKALSLKSVNPLGTKKQTVISDFAPIQRVRSIDTTAGEVDAILAQYVEDLKALKGASGGAAGVVYSATAIDELVTASDYMVNLEEKVVVKRVNLSSKTTIRMGQGDESNIPLEALLPEKLNAFDESIGVANETFVTIQVKDRGKIISYYLIMRYADQGDQEKKEVKYAEINEFNDEAKRYYKKLDEILSVLATSGYSSGDIKPANIFIDSTGMPMLGDFGDYTVGTYTGKTRDITTLMNNLMENANKRKTYEEIVAWAAGDEKWIPATKPPIPEVLPVEEAVEKAVVTGVKAGVEQKE